MRTLYYEEGLDEIALIHNPKGGRPAMIGQLCHPKETDTDISQIKEEVTFRYHIGYCTCGKRLVIGQNRAQVIAKALAKRGFNLKEPKKPLSAKIRLWLVRQLQPS